MMMNFAILGAYVFLVSPAFLKFEGDRRKGTLAYRLTVGACFGVLGIILLFFSINVNDQTPLNLRGIAIMLAAYFGGPVGALSELAVVYLGRWLKDGPIDATQMAVGITAAFGSGIVFSVVRTYAFKWIAGGSFLLAYFYFGLWLVGDLSFGMVKYYLIYQAGYAALIAALLYSILQNHQTKRLVKRAEQDKLELLRMQPGIVFRFEKRADGRYYYTLIEGRLLAVIKAEPADFIGKAVEEVRIFDEDYVRLLNGQYDGAWSGEEQSHEQPFLDVILLITLHPIRQDGVVTDVIGTGVDVTEMKKREEADASNRAKSRFLAQMSHEIRTPINAIIGLNHILQQSDLTERQRDYVGKSMTAAKSLLAIVNDVLDFSKIEAGKVVLEHIAFDLYEVLHNVSNLVGFRATEKGLKFRYDVRRDVPQMLVGDPFRLQQILLNVTNNAVKFTSEGELSISVRTEGCRTERQRIVFAVRDTGIGMSEEQTSRLFREFTQGDMTTTRKYGGTGLGLVISRRFAELMGGTIVVESELGRGSTFTIGLPLSPAATGESMIGERSLGVVRTLLVCADTEMRHVLRRQLEQLTLDVDVAEGPEEALDKLENEGPYALAMLDWRPECNVSVRLAERIRARQPGGMPALVVVSASHEPSLQAAFESCHIAKTLHYPISQSQLYNELCELVSLQPRYPAGGDRGNQPRYAALKDAVVLLTEDNEINQLVARELLRDVVARVDVASDGTEAVRLAEATRYDAILMDLQMPEMDGYEATKRIRRLANGEDVPIIAMTADAMKGVEEQAMEIGMNAYLTKPFDPAELYRALLRFARPVPATGRTAGEGDSLSAGAELVAASAEAPVPSSLDREGALARLGGNADVYARVLRLFASDHAGDVARIRDALAEGDRQRAELLSHALKGVAANVGATELAALMAELQAAALDVGREPSELLARAEAELRAVVREATQA